jgi:hypothetical protein
VRDSGSDHVENACCSRREAINLSDIFNIPVSNEPNDVKSDSKSHASSVFTKGYFKPPKFSDGCSNLALKTCNLTLGGEIILAGL